MKMRVNVLTRSPLLSFFVLSYALFWLVLALFGAAVGVFHLNLTAHPELKNGVVILGSWMPSLAAALVVGATSGRQAVAGLFAKLIAVPVAGRWILAAFIPAVVVALSVLGYRTAGGPTTTGVTLTLGFWLTWLLVNVFSGATGEEPGWRGFALPMLLTRFQPVAAGLLLGVIWSWWHLPLWLLSGYSGLDLLWYVLGFNVAIVSLSLLIVWLYLNVPHSLIPISIAHFAFNAGFQLAGAGGLGLAQDLPLLGWVAAGMAIAAGIVWIATPRRRLLTRSPAAR